MGKVETYSTAPFRGNLAHTIGAQGADHSGGAAGEHTQQDGIPQCLEQILIPEQLLIPFQGEAVPHRADFTLIEGVEDHQQDGDIHQRQHHTQVDIGQFCAVFHQRSFFLGLFFMRRGQLGPATALCSSAPDLAAFWFPVLGETCLREPFTGLPPSAHAPGSLVSFRLRRFLRSQLFVKSCCKNFFAASRFSIPDPPGP